MLDDRYFAIIFDRYRNIDKYYITWLVKSIKGKEDIYIRECDNVDSDNDVDDGG